MTLKSKSVFARGLDAAYRLMVLAYPAELRTGYGPEMIQVLRDQYRYARAEIGIYGVLAFWFHALSDVLRTAPIEHADLLLRDLRDVLQILRRQPAARKSIAVLALGIGAAGFHSGASFLTLLHKNETTAEVQRALTVLMSFSFWLWLGCVHIANELLVEAIFHQREIWPASASWATRQRFVRLLFTMGALFSMFGGIVGVLLAFAGTRGLLTLNHGIPTTSSAVAINPVILVLILMTAFLQRKFLKNFLAEMEHRYGCLLALCY
jgi:hypothetical protein